MSKQQRGLGKGISALFGDETANISNIRKPIGYINKEVVSEEKPQQGGSADVLLIPTPREYRSERLSTLPPLACSGEM